MTASQLFSSYCDTEASRMLQVGHLPVPTRQRGRESSDARTTDERVLFTRYQRHGDLAARAELIQSYLPLARSLAHRYARSGEPLDDLVQVASLALVKAIDRFEPDRRVRFSSYAVPTMLGELKRHFRDSGWALHVPREMQERVLKVNAAAEQLSRRLGRSPSPQQVANHLELPLEEVLEAIGARAAYDSASLDAPLRDDERTTIADGVGETDGRFELIEGSASIARALEALPARERSILHLRFARDLTQREIAQRMGISQMHVSRLIRGALEQMRVATGEGDAEAAAANGRSTEARLGAGAAGE